jgi:hypothetical protein
MDFGGFITKDPAKLRELMNLELLGGPGAGPQAEVDLVGISYE